jgi:lysosomal acid phosphatase
MRAKKIFLALFIIMFSSASFAAEQLIFAADVIRHGDRTPVYNIPNSPYDWQLGAGQLTSEGMHQEFLLGQLMHSRYIDKTHLLPAKYASEKIYVRSTDMDRTLMSAESFLLGLYPLTQSAAADTSLPGNFQPVPVHTLPFNYDDLLTQDFTKEPFKSLREKYMYTDPVWRNKEAEYKNKLHEWQELTGMPLPNLHYLLALGDHLFIRKLHHVPLPENISDATADEIIALAQWVYVRQTSYPEISNPFSYKLLKTLVDLMQDASGNKSALRYELFSAHDDTLSHTLTALGNTFPGQPHYASDLNFSLYKSGNNFFVRVTFNNVVLAIPGCGTECPLQKFADFVETRKLN